MSKKAFPLIGLFLILASAMSVQATPVNIRVVGPDNQPIANAQLVIDAFSARQTWVRQTDTAGRVALEMAPLADKRLGDVVVYAPGFGLFRADLDVPHRNTLIRLQKAKVIQGVVRDTQGNPVSGATVRLRDIEEPLGTGGEDSLVYRIPEQLEKTFTTRTGADGRWAIGGIPAQIAVVVALDDPSYVYTTARTPLSPSATTQIPVLTAAPGASIAGRVVTENGQPIVGVQVLTFVREPQYGSLRSQSAVTSPDGTYVLTSLTTGNYEVQVEDPTKKRVGVALKSVAAQTGQTTQAAPLLLTEGAIVQGRITDKATGKPLREIFVESYGPQGSPGPATATDAAGNYHLRLAPGTSRFYIGAPYGYVRKNLDVIVVDHEKKQLNLALSGGLTLSGTTVNDKGQPQGGVFLFIYSDSIQFGPDQRGGAPMGVTSDARGRWQIKGLAPGQITMATESGWQIIAPIRSVKVPTRGPLQVKVRQTQSSTK